MSVYLFIYFLFILYFRREEETCINSLRGKVNFLCRCNAANCISPRGLDDIPGLPGKRDGKICKVDRKRATNPARGEGGVKDEYRMQERKLKCCFQSVFLFFCYTRSETGESCSKLSVGRPSDVHQKPRMRAA